MDANANDVAGLNEFGLNLFKRLVSDKRITVVGRSRSGKHVQPTRSDHADPERGITRINKVDAH
jgi:hypothetical protein